jgi:hypothetical protein
MVLHTVPHLPVTVLPLSDPLTPFLGEGDKPSRAMKDKIRVASQIAFAILFIWFVAKGDLVENLWTEGMNGRNASDLMKQTLPALLVVTLVILALILLANLDRVSSVAFHLFSKSSEQPGEDPRLTEYRKYVMAENFWGSLRVFCGFLGLAVLFILAIGPFLTISGGEGLFAGGLMPSATRFGKFAFFIACCWGLVGPWSDYLDENGKECSRRKQMLARIESDPDWWRKRDEEQRQRETDHRELEARLGASRGNVDALREQEASLATLIHQLETMNSDTDRKGRRRWWFPFKVKR